jgi:hypothetical protein
MNTIMCMRCKGILSPLLVRPLNERSFEIVAGVRRYRAAQMAEVATVPVRIVNLTDAEAMEAALIENLIRTDVHPMEEATGFARLLALPGLPGRVDRYAAFRPSSQSGRSSLELLVTSARPMTPWSFGPAIFGSCARALTRQPI